MARSRGHYKEVIREKVLSVRLKEEEFLRLRVNALSARKPISAMVRDRLGGLIEAAPVEATTAAAGTTAAVTPAVESTPVETAVVPQAG
jgi:hypothetical protein